MHQYTNNGGNITQTTLRKTHKFVWKTVGRKKLGQWKNERWLLAQNWWMKQGSDDNNLGSHTFSFQNALKGWGEQ